MLHKTTYDEDKRDAYARSESPQKSFVQYFCFPSNDKTKRYGTRYRTTGNSQKIYSPKILIHKTDITLRPEFDLVMTKVLLLHNTLDHDMTAIKEIHDPIALLTDLRTDPLSDMTFVIDIDHAPIQEITTILQDIHNKLNTIQT